jgi:hypothetical protein
MQYNKIDTLVLQWRNNKPDTKAMMYKPIRFKSLIQFVTDPPVDEIDGDADIFASMLNGDFVFREMDTIDEKIQMLEEFYEEEYDITAVRL